MCSDFSLNGLLYIFCTCTNIILVLALVVPKYFVLISVLPFVVPKYFFLPGGIASSSFFLINKRKKNYNCNPEFILIV